MTRHLTFPGSLTAILLCAAALSPLSTAASTPDPVKLAIFDFEFEDMSAAASADGLTASDSQYLAEVTKSVRDLFAQSGRYSLVDVGSADAAEVEARTLRKCDGCDAAVAQQLGAEQSFVGVVKRITRTGRTDERVPVGLSGDALDELSALFNAMLDRIEGLVTAMRGALDNVSHDLRTPLTRLRGTAELALGGPADVERYREALADCVEECDRVLVMLDTLMDISEAESGTLQLHREPLQLAEIVARCGEHCHHPVEVAAGHAAALLRLDGPRDRGDLGRHRDALLDRRAGAEQPRQRIDEAAIELRELAAASGSHGLGERARRHQHCQQQAERASRDPPPFP